MVEVNDDFRSGFCAIIGCPNVGKSTLMNAILGDKVAITSPKPQTTRNRIMGIKTLPSAQLIFIDTPGIHRARDAFNKYMVNVALNSIKDVDVLIYTVEPVSKIREPDQIILEAIRKFSIPVILVINKIDMVPKKEILSVIDFYSQEYIFHDTIPISALHRDGLDILIDSLTATIPKGPMYYPPDMITDMPERFIAEELIREKIFNLMHQEIPFGCVVLIEEFKEDDNKNLIRILATIFVERESHKGMIIGKGGAMLKKIGAMAREDLEFFLGAKVFLKLWVKVEKDWTRNEALMAKMGYKI